MTQIDPSAVAPPIVERKRMAAGRRRDQMLAVAVRLVRDDGVSGLTLARLAEASGVSKPIAYQHFGTREGLLNALYAELGKAHEAAADAAIAAGTDGHMPREKVAEAVSAAFIDCALENGRLFTEIGAAIAASGEGHQAVRVDFGRRYAALLERFVGDTSLADAGYGFAIAFLGAGDSLAAAVLRDDVDREVAIATLCAILLATARSEQMPP